MAIYNGTVSKRSLSGVLSLKGFSKEKALPLFLYSHPEFFQSFLPMYWPGGKAVRSNVAKIIIPPSRIMKVI
jgi:hypothetical protein